MDKTSKYNLRKRNKKADYKINEESDGSDSSYDPDYESGEESDNEAEFNREEYQKFIAKLFPSKYMKKKIKENSKENPKKQSPKKSKKTKKTKKTKIQKKKKPKKEEQEEEEWEDEEDEAALFEEMLEEHDGRGGQKVNIVFTVGGAGGFYEDEESTDSCEADDEEEEEEEGDIKKPKWKRGDVVEAKLDDWEDWWVGTIVKVNENCTYKISFEESNSWDKIKEKYIRSKSNEFEESLGELKLLVKEKKKKGKEAMAQKFKEMAETLRKKRAKEKKMSNKNITDENCKDFRKLLKDKNVENDFKYFKGLPIEKQEEILEKLKIIKNYSNTDVPHRISIIESNIPVQYKTNALRKLNSLAYMDPGSGEYYKLKLWVDTFMDIPFGKYNHLPIKMDDGKEKCNKFMENAKEILDNAVYGMEDAKMQILQVLGQLISNPSSVGTAIALKGPPGTGKTTLIKEGVSKILKRPFAFLALGGATDSSFLEGHSYTYEGSVWGKVVDILIASKCMNPIIYFDELDKISDTPKGEEITGILTHLTDTTQNDKFHDKYFSNMDFNLSKVLYIFSYNDEKKVNPILKDRMYRIETKGYNKKQKLIIAKKYLIGKIEKNVNFEKEQIIIPDSAIEHIIEHYTEQEKGVRNLKRCLEIIYTKLNLHRLMKADTTLFEKEKVLKVEFPFTVKKEDIDKLIKNTNNSSIPFGLYM